MYQVDHLSGKPGTVREFDSCQGNVREKPCQRKRFLVNFMFEVTLLLVSYRSIVFLMID